MKPAFIPKRGRDGERGVTMILVALAMVAIIGMAALSIDVVTLYLAREEAQRAADQAALAAARVISVSGITGDPTNGSGSWQQICGGTSSPATLAAQGVAQQNTVASIPTPISGINVTYSAGASGGSITSNTDCSQLGTTAFGVNPMVTVKITRANLPSFFSRIWGNTGNTISATATAEAFNPSNSGAVGNQTTGTITPVQPRCVKPWVVPNQDPWNPAPKNGFFCNQTGGPGPGQQGPGNCQPLVNVTTGAIMNPGVSTGGNGSNGVIGENFWLMPDCRYSDPSNCVLHKGTVQPQANYAGTYQVGAANLLYVPGQVGTQVVAMPSCATSDAFNQAIVGCDQSTNYSCGVPNPGGGNAVDLIINPVVPTTQAASCLIHQGDTNDWTESTGQDYLYSPTFGAPNAYPFQINAGSQSPLVGAGLAKDTPITASNSIVSLPIYDSGTTIGSSTITGVTFVGFLQVFINAFDANGDVNVTVLNVAGCSNGNGTSVGATPVIGTSPVPVRLITPP